DLCQRPGTGLFAGRRIGHVRRVGPGLPAERPDLDRGRVEAGGGPPGEGHVGARLGQGPGHGAARPAAAPADEEPLALQVEPIQDRHDASPACTLVSLQAYYSVSYGFAAGRWFLLPSYAGRTSPPAGYAGSDGPGRRSAPLRR